MADAPASSSAPPVADGDGEVEGRNLSATEGGQVVTLEGAGVGVSDDGGAAAPSFCPETTFRDVATAKSTKSLGGTTNPASWSIRQNYKKIGSTRISALTRQVKSGRTTTTLDSKDQAIVSQLRAWDSDGDGELTVEDIVSGARKLIEQENRGKRLRRWLIFSVIAGVFGSLAMFLITKAVVESAKETHAGPDSLLVDTDGFVMGTSDAALRLNLADLTRMPVSIFKQVNKLTFTTDSGEHFTQVAYASKTANRLHITGQDGLKLSCTVLGCEVEFPNRRLERIWVNVTGNGRFLKDHEVASVDMAFAGYNSREFQAMVQAAAGHPGDFSLDSSLGPLEPGATCKNGVEADGLAEACGLEASTLVVLDEAKACSDSCGEAYALLFELCGLAGETHSNAGRRLASSEAGARTAAELLRFLGRYNLERCQPEMAEDDAATEPSSWTSVQSAAIGASWSKEQPTQMKLSNNGVTFLTQTIAGLRILGGDGAALAGVPPLVFTQENSYIESRSTADADFVTVYSVLPLGEKSAFRVIISQLLAKAPHVLDRVSIGPTAVCVGRLGDSGSCMSKTVDVGHLKFSIFVEAVGTKYALPPGAAALSLVVGLTPEAAADVVTVPMHKDNGDVSLESLIMQRPDGSAIWKYRFDQSYNVDNAETLDTVVVTPSPALEGAAATDRTMHVAIRLPIGEGVALSTPGSFLMYDPETFTGNERITRATPLELENMRIDTLGIAAASLIYSKYDDSAAAFEKSAATIGWLMEHSKILAGGNWKLLKFEGNHICKKDKDDDDLGDLKDEYLCISGGGKLGGAYGMLGGRLTGLVAFGGTDDKNDAVDDICAGFVGEHHPLHQKQVAKGFWQSYNQIRQHFKQVLEDFRDLGVEQLMLAGHSLGGAIASIATWEVYNSQDIASGYFRNRHLRTVTIGEPAAWNYPYIPWSTLQETSRTVVSGSGRRRWICSSSSRRRWGIGNCETYTHREVERTVTPNPEMEAKYHRYVTSVKQDSIQCQQWEQGYAWTFGIGASDVIGYKCETHDWDFITGAPTLGGNGMHGSRQTYWLGFDVAKAKAGVKEDVIGIYKESQTSMEYNVNFYTSSFSTGDLPKWIQDLLTSFTCKRRLKDSGAAENETLAKQRRLGILERAALHKGPLYFYWAARAVCEQTGVDGCDCPAFCAAWGDVNEEMLRCEREDAGLATRIGYSVCGTSDTDFFCSDTLFKPDKCNCLNTLPGIRIKPKCGE